MIEQKHQLVVFIDNGSSASPLSYARPFLLTLHLLP